MALTVPPLKNDGAKKQGFKMDDTEMPGSEECGVENLGFGGGSVENPSLEGNSVGKPDLRKPNIEKLHLDKDEIKRSHLNELNLTWAQPLQVLEVKALDCALVDGSCIPRLMSNGKPQKPPLVFCD